MALAQSLPNFIFAWMKLSLASDQDGITYSLAAGSGSLVSFGSGAGPGLSQAKPEELPIVPIKAKPEELPIVSILQLGDAKIEPRTTAPNAKIEQQFVFVPSSPAPRSPRRLSLLRNAKIEQRTTAPGASAPITAPVASDRLARFGAGGGPGLAPVPRIAASSKLRKFRSFGAASGDAVTSAPAFASVAGIPKAFAMELLEIREVQFGILLVVLLISICAAKICVPCLVSRRAVPPPRDDRLGYLFKVQDLETQRSGKYQRSLQSTANAFGSLPCTPTH